METDPQRPTGREDTTPSLNVAIAAQNLAWKNSNVAATKSVFRSVTDLLTMARVCSPSSAVIGSRFTAGSDSTPTANELDFVELGLFCADICGTLDRGTRGRSRNELNQPVHGAIDQLGT